MASEYSAHRAQIAAILTAWGMSMDMADRAAEVMAWADLHGIDSHGASMLTVYDRYRQAGRLNMAAAPHIVKQGLVNALVDGDGGLGHCPARLGMETAIAKARETGIGIVTVRNSAHFGAVGFYTQMAIDAGFVGLATTSAATIQVAPAGGAEARLGTDPMSFGAPGAPGRPFLLDMATTTVAAGKLRNKENEGLDCPPGWVLTRDGQPSVNPSEAREHGGYLTNLGGSLEGSSYKGYGLAVMVNILSAALSGSTLITDPDHTKKPKGMDLGHFFLVIDPAMFRPADDFAADVAALTSALCATRPSDPDQPVMIAGDPERQKAADRRRDGIPIAPALADKLRDISHKAGVPWHL